MTVDNSFVEKVKDEKFAREDRTVEEKRGTGPKIVLAVCRVCVSMTVVCLCVCVFTCTRIEDKSQQLRAQLSVTCLSLDLFAVCTYCQRLMSGPSARQHSHKYIIIILLL